MNNKVLEVLKDFGIVELRPPQQKALERGLLDKNKNFLISIPTASGKTLIGEMALINHLLDEDKTPTGKKGVFIVPLKALASEKYEEFKAKYERYGLKIALSIGDYDEDEDLSSYNLIITTAEKLDSLWRHKIDWIDDVSVVVVDEIHLINDETRGGTLEILLTKLKEFNIQIIGLSATIGNPEELAEWLNAELIVDDWRPVELKKGIYKNGIIEFINGENKGITAINNNDIYNLVVDCVKEGGCCLVFCNTKKGAVNEAKKLNLKKFLTDEEKKKLKEIAEEILSILEPPTEMCKTLAECILNGSAFHHAGLTYQHRKIVENAFRERLIKVICCTPTLSVGINVPCRRAIVKDLTRYTNKGIRYIPVMEIQQCIGRAGRPGLDPYGEGIIVAKNDKDYLRAYQALTQKPEPIYSKLSNQAVLRTQLLGLIATREIRDEYDLEWFIRNTFYAHQYGNLREVAKNIMEVIGFLEENEFIVDFMPTELGKRVSELYIDPLSAKYIIDGLNEMENENELYYLYLISKTLEMMPNLRVYKSEELDLINEIESLGIKSFDIEDLEAFKTAKMLYDWINEVPEDEILKRYKIEPGILRYKVENAVWIMHALKEIAKIIGKSPDVPEKLEIRLEYGAKEDIIELLNIKYIGRVRARKLYNAGIRSAEDIINNPSKVASIIGEKITKKILEELGIEYRKN